MKTVLVVLALTLGASLLMLSAVVAVAEMIANS
jgi:hypothetical protein